jgi:DNA-binding transcriptional LysR family regulator
MADIGDSIADLKTGDAVADRRDDAGPLDAERRGIGGQRIEAAAIVDVDVVHARVALADARFARAGRRQRDFARLQRLPGRPGRRWSWRGSSWRSSQSPFRHFASATPQCAKLSKSSPIVCKNAPMIDWDDLRIFAALARAGSLSAAARELGVDHATVGRRVAALERALALRLIDRLPRRAPADAARPRRRGGARADGGRGDRRRTAGAARQGPAASVRVSAPPALAAYVIAPRLAAFRRAHPDVTIALAGASGAAALDRGEADVAVRMGKSEETGLIVKRIGRARFALYAAPDVARAPREAWRYIGFDAALDRVTSQQWLKALAGKRELAFRASDLFSQAQAARAGLGVVVLPRFVGDGDPGLVEIVNVAPPPPTQDFWLLVYPDIRRAAATRAVTAFLAETIARACPLPGRGAPSRP